MAQDPLPPPLHPANVPESFNFGSHIVDYWANELPQQVALHWTDQTLSREKQLTYAHFSRQSQRVAKLLTSLGVSQGEKCVVILPRIPEWWEIATACLRAGIVLCPCTTLLVDKDIEFRLRASKAALFVGDEASVSKLLRVKQNCPDLRTILQIGGGRDGGGDGGGNNTRTGGVIIIDFHRSLSRIPETTHFETPESLTSTSPALIFFTSGTTGPPKMVRHPQAYPLAHVLTGTHWLRLSPDSVYWNLSEQGWAKAAWSFFASWTCGATLFVHDDRLAFTPRRTMAVLTKFPITTLCAPPTVYRQLVLDENVKFFEQSGLKKRLRHACGAGEPLNGGVIKKWAELTGFDIYDGYGQTETILVCANQAVNPIRFGSMGKPIPGVPLVIIDSDGKVTKDEEEGDIAICVDDDGHSRSPIGLFDGYITTTSSQSGSSSSSSVSSSSSSESLDRKVKRFPVGKKYYLTGDRAYRDSQGYFWFVGRGDDVINSSGYRIGPFEVESTLKLHPSVVESAVVASPDPIRDEVVKAFVVLTDAAAAAKLSSTQSRDDLTLELQNFCKENAAPYKYPRKIEFVDASFLPKTISGKIRRAELKRLEKERYHADPRQRKAKM
ncbi:hypothetical protein LTS17_003053 [Exophiala oligosperma]